MIWVIVDLLMKSSQFLETMEKEQLENFPKMYVEEIVVRHGVTFSIIYD